MPSRAPNNLCPRFRSSIKPLFRRSDALFGGLDGGNPASLASYWLSRGRFAFCSEVDDCLRFADKGKEASCSVVSSGTMTAEGTALETDISVGSNQIDLGLAWVLQPLSDDYKCNDFTFSTVKESKGNLEVEYLVRNSINYLSNLTLSRKYILCR